MSFARKLISLNKNSSTISGVVGEQDGQRAIQELRNITDKLIKAVTELQSLQVHSRTVEIDGLPQDASISEVTQGQFIRLTQSGSAPNILTVKHGLGRVPQGAIFIKQTGLNVVYIEGSVAQNIAPATKTHVTFGLNGNSGDLHVCILI
jgi:hypothetical protein